MVHKCAMDFLGHLACGAPFTAVRYDSVLEGRHSLKMEEEGGRVSMHWSAQTLHRFWPRSAYASQGTL